MFLLRPRNLNQALGWLLAAVIMPLLLGTLGLLAFQASQENRLAHSRLAALAQTMVQAADAEFERGRAQLEVLAASPQVDAQDWLSMRTFAAKVTRNVPGSLIVLVGPDGQVLFNTAVAPGEPLPNLWRLGARPREVIWEGRPLTLSSGNLSRNAYESGKPVYSNLYYGVQIHRPALAVSIPVVRESRSRYALIMSYPPSLLQERIQSAVQVPGIRAALEDRNGLVVASNAASGARVAERAIPLTRSPDARSGIFRNIARDGTPVMGAYAVSPLNGYLVRVTQGSEAPFLPARSTTAAWLALLLAAMVASTVLAGVISRRLARPLRELGEDVRAGRAPPPSRDTGIAEIDLLAQALRDGALAERQRVEEQTLRTVAQNHEALLRQADRQKDEFLATLAHELRNPLAPIRTAVEVIRRRLNGDPVAERARAAIERQTLHLSRLVDDLLDVSRITLGRVHLRQESVNLAEVAASAAESMAETAAQAGLVLERHIERSPIHVLGDPTRLTQCMVNLLNNAVKFTPAGGRVALRVGREGTRAFIEVQDSGVGISADNLDRIFELFVQERHSGHQGNTGLGIGLALTRRLVELHGGSIRADSDGLGHGSCFRVELPAVDAPVEVRDPLSQQVAGADGPTGVRVLVVDDNRDAAETLGELLTMAGYAVSVAHDGDSGVRHVRQHGADAVLLDIGLPDIDGYEACRRIRAQAQGSQPPLLIAVTGWGQESDRDAAQQAGFDGHMTKPVDPDELMLLLGERLALRRAGAEGADGR